MYVPGISLIRTHQQPLGSRSRCGCLATWEVLCAREREGCLPPWPPSANEPALQSARFHILSRLIQQHLEQSVTRNMILTIWKTTQLMCTSNYQWVARKSEPQTLLIVQTTGLTCTDWLRPSDFPKRSLGNRIASNRYFQIVKVQGYLVQGACYINNAILSTYQFIYLVIKCFLYLPCYS